MSNSSAAQARSLAFTVGAVGALALTLSLIYVAQSVKSTSTESPRLLKSKSVSESSVAVSYTVTSAMVDAHGRLYAGEVLKIMDVLAGVASKKHCGLQTVTISLDRVIFLRSVNVGDLLHFVVSVNRTWASSLECGVRCVREAYETGEREYACHAYFTFVAKVPIHAPPKSWVERLGLKSMSTTNNNTPGAVKTEKFKGKVPEVIPQTTLEQKRYLLAQRRRTIRMRTHPSYFQTLSAFREYLLQLSTQHSSQHVGTDEDFASNEKGENLRAVEKSYIIDAYLRNDPDVVVDLDKGVVTARVEGTEYPVSVSIEEVEKETTRRRSMSISRHKGDLHSINTNKFNLPLHLQQSEDNKGPSSPSGWRTPVTGDISRPLKIWETHAMELQVVRPEHCNSVNVLFGGVAMRWLEEVSAMAARRLYTGPWYTLCIDSLVFRNSVVPGEVVYLRAFVLKTWSSSAEIYATAYAESRTAPHNPRFVNDAFFTMSTLHPKTGRPMKNKLRSVEVSDETIAVQEVVGGAEKRRDDRLRERQLLELIYA